MTRCRYCLQSHPSSECPDAQGGEFDDGPSLGDILRSVQSRANEIAASNQRHTQREKQMPKRPMSEEYVALVSKLIEASESDDRINTIKSIRNLLQFDIDVDFKQYHSENEDHYCPRATLQTATNIYNAFTDNLTEERNASYDRGYKDAEENAKLTFESNPQPAAEELSEPEYLLIMFDENNDKYTIHRYYDRDDAMRTAEQEIECYPTDVTVAKVLARTVTKRTMQGV